MARTITVDNPIINGILRRTAAFRFDRAGQTAITFGLALFPMLLVIGSAVDYSRAVATRSNLQQATDSAVLAMTHSYVTSTSTEANLKGPSQTYLTGAMNASAPTTTTVTYNGQTATLNAPTVTNVELKKNKTEMCLTTAMIIPTIMMSIINQKYMATTAYACSATANTYEIALALDNSGSMSKSAGGASKMDSLKTAAAQLVDILIPTTSTVSTSIAVVPFTSMVNVGTSTNAAFLDKAGTSVNHWQNFHRPAKASFLPKSKFELYGALGNATWGGCVEERASPYIATDTAPSTATPNTLFVPFFAPDDPGAQNATGSYACWPYDCSAKDSNGNYYPFDQSTAASGHNHAFTNSYITDNGASSAGANCPTNTKATTGDSLYYQYDTASTQQADGQTTNYPGAGITMLCKYNGASVEYSGNSGTNVGPNNGCPATQIAALNNTNASVKSAINSMVAAGSTNLVSGFMWGWRTISPTFNPFPVGSPGLTGPQNPKPYNQTSPQNTKIVILMTDGMNSWGAQSTGSPPLYFNNYTPNESNYEGFGYFSNDRLAAYYTGGASASYSKCQGTVTATTQSTYRCLMDAATREACKRAYNAGVIVYTIGFSVAGDEIDDQGKQLLQDCAFDPSYYYPATDSTSIQTAFKNIAASIQSLRLSD